MTSVHQPEDVRIFHKECVSLAASGFEVYLVERGESYDKNGVHIVGVGDIPESRGKRMTEGAKKVYRKALELDCDIYHFHDPELLPYGLKLKKKGKRVFFDSHENTADAIMEKQYLPFFFRRIIRFFFVTYQFSICRRLDAVITVTPSMTRDFEKIHPKVVEVRNYPIVTEDFRAPAFSGKRIAFAGGISAQWNHHILLKAMEKIPGCRYSLCGSCDDAYLQELKRMKAWNQVDYLGKVPHAQVSSIMREAAAGVALLSPGKNTDGKNGTMGNTKIFEEMMAALPIICTDFDLWSEFVERYQCGICVDPTDPDKIAEAISFVFADLPRAEQMGRNGRRAVEEEFNWDRAARALLQLYSE